ncbi:hypothetical protein GUITHDRAFT_118277 [Guillardia theta CCMP2712]|uniref:FZ domain-containing protein n=1 Tax=Guillardia theta (strain CCMP2712) TaxID=905079 RepID=L1IH59_GUITC|nr:hypothetical protein GUITHDRAFT_118277 [Guillardia theta CCMP2712]EKX35573.1 hypothetical protein GUITHDRAFT_118277 [Guillardia theta CCMP2712]|eukprot:XP_005822553.1 hypothetical protein GUITHDRAFT_118277 [Guillardia theta CCMP2712]
MERRLQLVVYLCLHLGKILPVHAGTCVVPPPGILEFCSITYPSELDPQEFLNLDRGAERFAYTLFSRYGCDSLAQNSACLPYVCANYFPKCSSDGNVPMKVCRSECVRCLSTCRYERTILPPGMFLNYDDLMNIGKRTMTTDPMQSITFDEQYPTYKCRADRNLVGPEKESYFYQLTGFGNQRKCTSGARGKQIVIELFLSSRCLSLS